MEERRDKHIIQQVFDTSLSGIQDDPWLAQRVLSMAHGAQGQGGKIVKKKISLASVLLVCLMLISGVAIAASFVNLHIEKTMDIIHERGAFAEWTLEDKLGLIGAMEAEGIALPQEQMTVIRDANASEEQKQQAADELLTGIYGSEEHISYLTMASHDWGDPFVWTLEQKAWFWETLREKGLYTGATRYLLPDENDLTREQVVQLAKDAVQAAYHLPDDVMQGYDADVTFFTVDGTDAEPRWRVCIGYAWENAAEYEVLLTRDGQVTEDASLYIFRPETMAVQQAAAVQPSTVLKPYEKRMLAANVLYVSANGWYHFLPDCPSSAGETLKATDNIDGLQPCPYCISQTQLWSAEDKIRYGVMGGELPMDGMLTEAQAEDIARSHLLADGMSEAGTLTAYSRYNMVDGSHCYEVYFAELTNGQIEDVCMVIVSAETGAVIRTIKSFNGLG